MQAIVYREARILMAQHRERAQTYWCLPGGGLEGGETPEEGVLRELSEEACVKGRVVRRIGHTLNAHGAESYSFLIEIGDQQPTLGHDPELVPDAPILVDLQWLSLREIPERDRAFLWYAGLMNVPEFLDEVKGWGDKISYPG